MSAFRHNLLLALLALQALETAALGQVNVLTYHNDFQRTGQNLHETILTPANVNLEKFGLLFTLPVDGYVYSQPLYLSNLTIPQQGVHNVVFVATEHNGVYAFDADSPAGSNAGVLWHVNLGPSAATPNNDFGNRYGPYHDINPEIGITSTPVIDPIAGIIYLDAFTHEGASYFHRIHALSIFDGSEQLGSPLTVSASVRGVGAGSANGILTFDPLRQLQRPALTLVNGTLYAAYSGYADTDPYHGWVIGFGTNPLQLLPNQVWVTTPNSTVAQYGSNAGEAGIWMGGDGLAVDSANNLFAEIGNGTFDNVTEYGDSFVKLSTVGGQLALTDYFTPYNEASLSAGDVDLGSGGTMLLPDAAGTPSFPHLLVGAGKEGKIYLLNRDRLTAQNQHYNGPGGPDRVIQSVSGQLGPVFSTAAYFNGQIYYAANGDVLKAFSLSNATLSSAPVSAGPRKFSFPGSTPSISANGASNGLVWVTQMGSPAVLTAYNAANLTAEIYNSSLAGPRDQLPPGVKFTVPTVANGKVYVGTQTALAIFGLLPVAASPPAAPSSLSARASSSATVSLAWVDNSNNEAGFEVWRSTDGLNFTLISVAAPNSLSYSDAGLAPSTTYYYKVRAENSAGPSAFTSIVQAATLGNQANPGLIARWPLDDGGSVSVAEVIGGDNGSIVGEATWVAGKINGALSFHGGGNATARVMIPDEAALRFGLGDSFTLAAWINPANAVGKYSEVIAKSRDTGAFYELGIDPANHWIFRGPSGDVTGSSASAGWHHLAAVQDGAAGTRSLYVDGVLSGVGAAQAADGTGALWFAEANSVSESFSGLLDEVRIYQRALSIPEVATLSNPVWLDSDVGSVGAAGSATIYQGQYTINASGADIWNAADAFHYVYQTLSGNFQITARVISVANTDPWSKAGLMIRGSLDAGAPFADCVVTPGNGVNFQYRQTAGGTPGAAAGAAVTAPDWVRLSRSGNTVTAYQSPDGVNWTPAGAATVSLPAIVYLGLAVTAHNNAALCTATFDNVLVNTPGSLSFSQSTYSVSEQAAAAMIAVVRTGGSLGAVGVSATSVAGGSAVNGVNFNSPNASLQWADGDSAPKSFALSILDSHLAGPNLDVDLALGSPTGGASLGAAPNAVLTILEDPWDAWAYAAFGSSANNQQLAAPTANPSGDGLVNLLKYAMALNPNLAYDSSLASSAKSGVAQISFTRAVAASDVTYVVEGTNLLGAGWLPVMTYTAAGGWQANLPNATVSEGAPVGAGPYQVVPVTVTDATPLAPGSWRYLRLRVTR